jgi:hypothetical protein
MVNYRVLLLRLAWRRIAELESAPRHGLRLLKPAPRHLRLVAGQTSGARSGSIHPRRASGDINRSRE